jgi:acetyl-CoA C-acetyltransferase
MRIEDVDDQTPVIVGVAQVSERPGEAGYLARSPVELAAAAAAAALDDALDDALVGTRPDPARLAAVIDTIAATRLFDESFPMGQSPLGRCDNVPRSVASRIGAQPRHAVLAVSGGQSPQHLVTEFAAQIAAGGSEATLVIGAEAISTGQMLAARDDPPSWDEHIGGGLDDRGHGLEGIVTEEIITHGLTDTPSLYALLENARRARLGLSREAYALAMGEVFAPFTEVAATNPHSAATTVHSAQDLATPTAANRPIADPYTRYLVARDKVNQASAVLLMSVGAARRAGLSPDRWVFIHGHADLHERSLLDRPDLGSAPALAAAALHALEVAGVEPSDVATFDLYSCYPIAVTVVADALGLAPSDPRRLTVTGGLPFFGGPGNSYSLHAIAETVQRSRCTPGAFGFVGANGGILSKYSAAVYSTTPVPWRTSRSQQLQAALDAVSAPPQALRADGAATIESFTVRHGRGGRRSGVVVGRLDAGGERFLATVDDQDDAMLALLMSEQPVGQRVAVRSSGQGNRVTIS